MTEPLRYDYPDVWLYEPRGGYGYTLRIPCRVVTETAKRVTVRVPRKDGTVVTRHVSRERVEMDRRAY